MKDVGNFFGLLVYFTAISYILWPLGVLCGHFGIFSRFGTLCQEKSGNPANNSERETGAHFELPATSVPVSLSLPEIFFFTSQKKLYQEKYMRVHEVNS
jgi:hypothetical protein